MGLAPLFEVINLRLRDHENSLESLRLEVVELVGHVRRIVLYRLHRLNFHDQVRIFLSDTNEVWGT